MRRIVYRSMLLAVTSAICVAAASSVHAVAAWNSPDHYRLQLTVDAQGLVRRNSPAALDVDLQQALIAQGGSGTVDENTIEVMAYSSAGQPAIFDASRTGYEKYLLPWRIEKYYPISRVTLHFVMPDETYTQYFVYFDTAESGLGKPTRYRGIVGDGDKFSEGYKRREIGAAVQDSFADLDGDGDLDLFRGGVEPYIYCWENVGGNKFVERGKLTSGGNVLVLPYEAGNNRSWTNVDWVDWENDGDLDMFIHFTVSNTPVNYSSNVVRYENVTSPGGQLTFVDRGMVKTQTGNALDSPGVTFVDWDGDGKKDVLTAGEGIPAFHRNVGTDSSPIFADGVYIKANGAEIQYAVPRMDCADIDNDGDLDLFSGSCEGKVYWFENVGTRTNPVFTEGWMLQFFEGGYSDLQSAVKVADFDGDGLKDIVVSCYWKRTHYGEQGRVYARMLKNVGTLTNPVFEARDADHGAPYTEGFQQCDVNLQNGVRCVDWNGDGKLDLLGSDTDGFVWYFRNLTNQLYPVYATGERMQAVDGYVHVQGEEQMRERDGYARIDTCDWNNDGKTDLVVADGGGWIWLYLNIGTPTDPVLAAGNRIEANGHPIDGTARSSVLICDWDNDGKKDIIHAVCGQFNTSEFYDWPWQGPDPMDDAGYLFYKNVGADAAPVLDRPIWVSANDGIITYSRPNCGAYVDWDGDGKKDFIGAQFEVSAKLYTNIGSGAPGVLPVFASKAGLEIVHPWTIQTMSGADAVNFNGDAHPNRPEYDILTGQGHGGSGLRFYERDYIEDFLNNTYPIVTTGATAQSRDLTDAKGQGNGASFTIPEGVVTANFSDCFYIETENRQTGMRVEGQPSGVEVGDKVDVSGSMATNAHGERYMAASAPPVPNGAASVVELSLAGKALGGADLDFNPGTGAGQRGITSGVGTNNIGLLVQIFGVCSVNLAISGADFYGNKYMFVDDGSRILSWYRAVDGTYEQVRGIKVEVDDASIAVGAHLTARGISSIELVNGVYQSRLLPRAGMGDIAKTS